MSTAIADSLATGRDTVTRIEIADHVDAAFRTGPAGRDALLAAARAADARPAVLTVLAGLPDQAYPELRALWTELAEIPIGL